MLPGGRSGIPVWGKLETVHGPEAGRVDHLSRPFRRRRPLTRSSKARPAIGLSERSDRAYAPASRSFDAPPYACAPSLTGVSPRAPTIAGSDHPKVLSYVDVLAGNAPVGARVAIIGAGGIGFDVAEFLTHEGHSPTLDAPAWYRQWGIDATLSTRGGLAKPAPGAPVRQVYLIQRSTGKLGEKLNKTSGWVHRSTLKMARVEMIGGVSYEGIDDRGLKIRTGEDVRVLEVDNVVVCAGQEPNRTLYDELITAGKRAHVIGGAHTAGELDAKRAIDQATRLAVTL